MYYDSKQFTARVVQGDDGVYRWVYKMNPRRNKHPLSLIGKVFFSMAALSAAILLIVGSPDPLTMSDWAMPLMILGLFLGIFLLVTLILYLQGDDPIPFAMDEKSVTTFRAKGAGPHLFCRMRRVRLLPQYDAIRLGFGTTIYVPQEDYDLVKSFLLEHLPPDADVR